METLINRHNVGGQRDNQSFEPDSTDADGLDSDSIAGLAIGQNGSPLPCAISISSSGDPYVLRIHGAMNLSTEPFLRHRISRAITQFNAQQLVFDMTYCEPLDAIGLGLLVMIDRDLKKLRRRLLLAHPSPLVRRIFAITGVDKILTVIE